MSYKKIIALLIITSIILKALFLFASGVYNKPQPYEYEDIAQNMLRGDGFYYENFHSKYYIGLAPGFPILCYVVYKLFGHRQLIIIFIQIVISSLLIIPISLIAHRLFDEKTAILAGILTAVYPPLIIYSTTKLHPLSIYACIFAFLVWSFFYLKDRVTTRRVMLVGLLAGLAALFRATSIAFLILALVWFYFASRENSKKKIRAVIIILSILIIALLPNAIKSYVIFGKPLFLYTNKGEALWLGNMPNSNGGLFTEGGVTIYSRIETELPPEFFKMNEIERGDYLKKLTIGYFKSDPRTFITRIIKKIYYFWWFSPYQGSLYPALWMKLYKVYYLFVLIAALFSIVYNFLILKKKSWIDALLIGLFFLALTGVHSLYYVEARHRWAIEAFMLIFAANTLIILKENIVRVSSRTPR